MILQADRIYVNIPKEGLKDLGPSSYWIPEAVYLFENHAKQDAHLNEKTVTLQEALKSMCDESLGE